MLFCVALSVPLLSVLHHTIVYVVDVELLSCHIVCVFMWLVLIVLLLIMLLLFLDHCICMKCMDVGCIFNFLCRMKFDGIEVVNDSFIVAYVTSVCVAIAIVDSITGVLLFTMSLSIIVCVVAI